VECSTCTLLDARIRKSKKGTTAREQLLADQEEHWRFQERFRDNYATTIVKAIENDDSRLSISLDGSGTDPHSSNPYYQEDFSSGEPKRQDLVRLKSMFSIMHGFGRIVFLTYPMLEKQGTNLVLEVHSFKSVCVY